MNIGRKIIKIGLVVYTIFACIGISGMQLGLWISIIGLLILVLSKEKIFFYTNNKTKKIFLFCLIFIIWNFLVTIFGIEPKRGILKLIEFVGPIFFIFAVINVQENIDSKFFKQIIFLIILFCVLESIYGTLQYFTGIDFTHKIKIPNYRIRGTMGYYNSLGGVLGMMVPFIYGNFIFTNKEKLKEKQFFLISFILSVIALILTFTRGAWMGAILGVLVITIYKFGWKGLFFIIVLPILIIFNPVRNRIKDTQNDPQGGRKNIWVWSLEMIKESPILGYGFNSFQKLLSKKDIYYGEAHFHSHNVYLNTFVESGLIGILLLLTIMFLIIIYILQLVQENKIPIVFGILGVVIDFYLHGLVDNVLWGETMYMFWFFIGILFLLSKEKVVKL